MKQFKKGELYEVKPGLYHPVNVKEWSLDRIEIENNSCRYMGFVEVSGIVTLLFLNTLEKTSHRCGKLKFHIFLYGNTVVGILDKEFYGYLQIKQKFYKSYKLGKWNKT